MSLRELVALGTGSRIPTRRRNHNAYFLRWDEHGFLLDPGEGTQRQMTIAGIPMSAVTKIFITHFHGDHSLGLASVVQRISLDRVSHPVEIYYPESGQIYYDRLVAATIFHNVADLAPRPLPVSGAVVEVEPGLTIQALPLDHPVDTLGYRIRERDDVRFLRDRLRELGLSGPIVGELHRTGQVEHRGETIRTEDVSEQQPGAVFAFVMDTRLTATCTELARDADLLVCESTYLSSEAELAAGYGHLTAAQAATIARDAGVRHLLLTHFSQRYQDVTPLLVEAEEIFPEVVLANDFGRYPFPRPRRRGAED